MRNSALAWLQANKNLMTVRAGTLTKVREGHIITASETITIVTASGWRNRRMTKFPPPFRVRLLVPCKVIAGRPKAILKALALNFAELLWRRIPAAALMIRGRTVLGREKDGRCQGKSKHHKD
jgi:hypothetical protein